jgi:hypothetical protein
MEWLADGSGWLFSPRVYLSGRLLFFGAVQGSLLFGTVVSNSSLLVEEQTSLSSYFVTHVISVISEGEVMS